VAATRGQGPMSGAPATHRPAFHSPPQALIVAQIDFAAASVIALRPPLPTEECSVIEQGRHAVALRRPPSRGMLQMVTPAPSVD